MFTVPAGAVQRQKDFVTGVPMNKSNEGQHGRKRSGSQGNSL